VLEEVGGGGGGSGGGGGGLGSTSRRRGLLAAASSAPGPAAALAACGTRSRPSVDRGARRRTPLLGRVRRQRQRDADGRLRPGLRPTPIRTQRSGS